MGHWLGVVPEGLADDGRNPQRASEASALQHDLEGVARVVGNRPARQWAAVLDAPLASGDLVGGLDEEFLRAGLLDWFSESGAVIREALPSLAAVVIGALAESDGGLAAAYLARVAGALPWIGSREIMGLLVDGWSSGPLQGAPDGQLWAWGWRAAAAMTVCVCETAVHGVSSLFLPRPSNLWHNTNAWVCATVHRRGCACARGRGSQ
ncbi:MAG: hypothetical protein N3C12_07345 [Candidatus Binatia bacterium]|nr:hypothetical protein [Candidatus Binatia bacterium]